MESRSITPITNVAFGDINGDCKPDLIMHVSHKCDGVVSDFGSVVIRTARRGPSTFGRAAWDWCIDLTYSPGTMTVVDVNADGTSDLVIPEGDGGNRIFIYENVQDRRDKEDLCAADNGFRLPSHTVVLPDSLQLTGCNGHPSSVHFGDYDIDGYPDMLIGVRTPENSTRVVVLRNSKDFKFRADAVRYDDSRVLVGKCVGAFIDLVRYFREYSITFTFRIVMVSLTLLFRVQIASAL